LCQKSYDDFQKLKLDLISLQQTYPPQAEMLQLQIDAAIEMTIYGKQAFQSLESKCADLVSSGAEGVNTQEFNDLIEQVEQKKQQANLIIYT
jgi:hypothetical protein